MDLSKDVDRDFTQAFLEYQARGLSVWRETLSFAALCVIHGLDALAREFQHSHDAPFIALLDCNHVAFVQSHQLLGRGMLRFDLGVDIGLVGVEAADGLPSGLAVG